MKASVVMHIGGIIMAIIAHVYATVSMAHAVGPSLLCLGLFIRGGALAVVEWGKPEAK